MWKNSSTKKGGTEREMAEHILDTFDELSRETMEIMKEKGISLTVDDFLKERER
jgi:hypothetical protein